MAFVGAVGAAIITVEANFGSIYTTRPGRLVIKKTCACSILAQAIHGLVDMMNAPAPLDTYIWADPIHPTVSELISTVLREMKPVSPGA